MIKHTIETSRAWKQWLTYTFRLGNPPGENRHDEVYRSEYKVGPVWGREKHDRSCL